MSVRVLLELNVKPENADDVIGFQGPDTASRNSPASCQPRAVGERHVRRAAPGVVVDARGHIQVDDTLKTSVAGVWALGECNGRGAYRPGCSAGFWRGGPWYRLAADQGHAAAQFSLGIMYSNGQGVPQDDMQANMWYSIAAAQSSREDRDRYAKARDAAAERLTSEQLAEAQRLAREWKPTPER